MMAGVSSKRAVIRSSLWLAAISWLGYCSPALAVDSDHFEWVVERAKAKAAVEFRRPKRVANRDFDFANPPDARGLVYAEALKIVPRRPIVENEGTGYSAYPRRGTAWEPMRIFVQLQPSGAYSEYVYDRNLIDYESPDIVPPLPQRIPRAVQHWTEVGVFAPVEDGFPQLVNMRANGYMRLASKGTIYGYSERGFVEQAALDDHPSAENIPENFPLLTEVFLAYPSYRSATVYQIFENESAVLARRLVITMGGDTVMKVTGRLIPRMGRKLSSRHNIGIAHISMYWKGSRENAVDGEHAHDSDTVEVTYEDGSRQVVDIPVGPSRTDARKFVFVDLQGSKSVTGYSLEQRDRNPDHYLGTVAYHKRASMHLSDIKWNVPTQTQLIVLPDDGEFFDNVVLRTVIRPRIPTSEVIQFSYTETIPQL